MKMSENIILKINYSNFATNMNQTHDLDKHCFNIRVHGLNNVLVLTEEMHIRNC